MSYLPFRRRKGTLRGRTAPAAAVATGGAASWLATGDAAGQPGDGLADRVLGLGADDRLAGVGRVRDLRTRSGSRRRCVMPSVLSTLSGGEPDLVVGPVEDQVAVGLREVQQVEGLDGDLDVLQRRDVERGDQQQLVGLVEGLEDVLVEGRGGVDDDVVEVRLEQAQDPADQRRRDGVLRVRLDRGDQRRELAAVRRSAAARGRAKSRPLSRCTASAIVRAGNSWRVIATSPKARSRSTRQTVWSPLSVSASARLTASVVLPTPPLGEKTVIRRAAGALGRAGRRAVQRLPDLVGAVDGRAEPGQVALVDDLAHAASAGPRRARWCPRGDGSG